MKHFLLAFLVTFALYLPQIDAAPVVNTKLATQIDDLSAMASGTVNVNSVGYWLVNFEIGKTNQLELPGFSPDNDQFWIDGAVSGNNTVTFNALRIDLKPSTTYYYRIRARNSNDLNEIYYGEIQSFTTLAPNTPPVATATNFLSPPPISHKDAIIPVRVFAGSSPTKIYLQYGVSNIELNLLASIDDLLALNTTDEFNLKILNLSPETTYYYRWMVTNAQGTTYSENKSFDTKPSPTLQTNPATEIIPDSAMLNGFININGGSHLFTYFQYGTTTEYGETLTLLPTYNADGETSVSGRVPSLKSNTTYHYRIVTHYFNNGIEYGNDVTFTTKVAGEKPIFQAIPTTTQVNISNATVTMPNLFTGTSATSLKVEYGTTAQYGETTNDISPFTSFTTYYDYNVSLTDLEPETLYHYRFVATNLTGSVTSESLTFVTPASPIITNISPSFIGDIYSDVTADFTTNGGELQVGIEYGLTADYTRRSYLAEGVSGSGTNSRTFRFGTDPNTLYHYRVFATDGDRFYYGEDSTLTSSPPTTLPQLSDLKVQLMNEFGVFHINRKYISADAAVVWAVFFAGGSTATLEFEYGKNENFGHSKTSDAAGHAKTTDFVTMMFTDLEPETLYYWRAKATNSSGTVYSETLSFTTLKAPTVTTTPAISVTDTSVIFTGSIAPDRWGYDLKISYGLDTSRPFLAEQITPAYVDGVDLFGAVDLSTRNVTAIATGLRPNTTYYYRLKARASQVFPSSYYNGEIFSFTTAPPNTPPQIEADLALLETSETSAKLQLLSFNAGSSESTVTFEYGTTLSYGSEVIYPDTFPINVVAGVQTTLQNLSSGTTYHARVKITNAQGTVYSPDFEFTTLPPGSKPSFGGEPATQYVSLASARLLVGSLDTGNAETTLTFEYGLTDAYGDSVSQVIAANLVRNSPYSNISGLTPNTLYHFRATASSAYGTVSTVDATFNTPPEPTATTEPPTSITDLSASLNGVVNPHGTSGYVRFDWGETTDYGNESFPPNPWISGVVPINVSLPLDGLKPNTTYHFRIRYNSTPGKDFTFTTGPPASLPSITGELFLFELSNTRARIRIPEVNAGGSPARISFEYGTSSSFSEEVSIPQRLNVGDVVQFPTATLENLIPDTLHQARCKVTNDQGTVYSEEITFSTAFILSTQPATNITDIDANFHGIVNAGGSPVNIYFQWGSASNMTNIITAVPAVVQGVGHVAVSAAPFGLLPDTTYSYRLRSVDATGFISYGPTVSFNTGEASSSPSVIGPIITQSVGLTTASFRTTSVRSGGDVATISFEYGTTTAYGSSIIAGSPFPANYTGISYGNLSSLLPDTLYHIRIKASNAYGVSYSEDATFTTLAERVVTALPATEIADLSATLNAMLQLNGNPDSYKSFHYGTGGSYNRQVSAFPISTDPTTGLMSFAVPITHLTPNTTYNFKFKSGAVESSEMTFTTASPRTRPIVPEEIPVVQVSDTKASFYTGLISSGSSMASLEVEYGMTVSYGSKVNLSSISLLGQANQTVTLLNLSPNTIYHVRVKATNSEGSSYSPDFTFTTYGTPTLTIAPVESITDISAMLRGIVKAGGRELNVRFECRYNGQSYGNPDSGLIAVSGNESTPITYHADQNLPAGETYTCKLSAYDGLNEYFSNIVTFTTLGPATPPMVIGDINVIKIGAHSASFRLTSNDGFTVYPGSSTTSLSFEYGTLESYNQSVDYFGTFQPPSKANASNTVNLTGLNPGETYHVRVKATNAQGSTYSETATAVFTTLPSPDIETLAPTEIGEFSATLNGAVNVNDTMIAMQVDFEWGLTESFGKIAYGSPSYLPPGQREETSGTLMDNLLPGTRYYYRLRASYFGDYYSYFYGETQTFLTSPPSSPPSVVNPPVVTFIKSTSALVSARYFTGGSSANVVLEYGTTSTFGSVLDVALSVGAGTNGTTNYLNLADLQPETQYFVRTRATNAQGTAVSPVTTFTTTEVPVPYGLAAINITINSASLTGRIQAQAAAQTARFEWGFDSSYGNSVGAYRSGTTYTSNISNLLPSRTYHYRLVLVEGSLTTYSDDMTFTTSPLPTPPTLSENLTVYNITADAATAWIGSVSAPADIIFEYGLTTAFGSQVVYPFSIAETLEFKNVAVDFTELIPDTVYYYRCSASNSQGEVVSLTSSFRTLPAPDLLSKDADEVLGESARLMAEIDPNSNLLEAQFEYGLAPPLGVMASFSPSDGDGDIPVSLQSESTYFHSVAAIDSGGGRYVEGDVPVSLQADVANLQPESTYFYRVTAIDSRGKKYVGPSSSFTTLSPLTYDLTYTADNGGSIDGQATQAVVSGDAGSAVTAVAGTGYTFSQWSDGNASAVRTDTITADTTYTASFNPTFTTWSGGSDFAADANGDGISNGVAWVLGADNPSTNAISLLPTTDNTSDANYFIYTYRRSDVANGDPKMTIAVQYGSDLSTWTTAVDDGDNIIISLTNDFYGSGVDQIEVKIKRTLSNQGKLFTRLSVTYALNPTFITWSGGSDFSADPNGDGISSGVAWVLGADNPSTNATSLLPTTDNTSDANYFIYTYRRSDDANGDPNMTIAVQYGSDLSTWTTAVDDGDNIIISSTNDFYSSGVDQIEIKIKRSLSNQGMMFMRLSVTYAP